MTTITDDRDHRAPALHPAPGQSCGVRAPAPQVRVVPGFDVSAFPSLRLVRSSRIARRTAKALIALLGFSILGLVWIPWQQTVAGKGRVVTYDPNHRLQEVDAPISGRLVNIKPGLVENMHVTRGEVLMEIEVIDEVLKHRLDEQLFALERSREAKQTVVKAYEQYLRATIDLRQQAQVAGQEFVAMAQQKLRAKQESLKAAEASSEQAEKDAVRRQNLLEKRVGSRFDWEVADRKAKEAAAKVQEYRAEVKAAEHEVSAKQAELLHKIRDADAKIESARADFRKAESDVASTEKEIADTKAKQSLQVQPVLAPLDGYILKLKTFQGGQIVSSGQPLLELVPSTADRAVEIKVDGNDAPLVTTRNADGSPRKVRLQFEGWPAVQFSGWPSVAVGTFGGIVATIDSSDDGYGRFRVLVIPDPADRPWPQPEYLRQGVRANGWVLLNEVRLGQELWRLMNGFPPVVAPPEPLKEEKLLRGKK